MHSSEETVRTEHDKVHDLGSNNQVIHGLSRHRTWEVYRITCNVTGKSYVGKGNAKKRWTAHKRQARSDHRYHLHDAIKKYGEDSFVVSILKTFDSETMAYEYEKFLIDSEDLTRCGYNEAPGMIISVDLDQTNIKRSATIKNGWSDIRRLNQRERYSGTGNPFFGRSHDDETKSKMSTATSQNLIAHAKISASMTGHEVSQETRTKMSFSSKTRGKSLEAAFGAEKAAQIKTKLKLNQPDRRGEKHPSSKLSELDVVEIKRRSIDKQSDKILAREFSVSTHTIGKIRLGYTWKHVCHTTESGSTSS